MFSDEELSEILKILAIVLHLGNVEYIRKSIIVRDIDQKIRLNVQLIRQVVPME